MKPSEIVDFSILDRPELADEYAKVESEAKKIKATSDEMVDELHRKRDMLSEQIRATENKCYEDINNLRRRNMDACEYDLAVELKKKFDARVAELKPIYGDKPFQMDKNRNVFFCENGLLITFGAYGSDSFTIKTTEGYSQRFHFWNDENMGDKLQQIMTVLQDFNKQAENAIRTYQSKVLRDNTKIVADKFDLNRYGIVIEYESHYDNKKSYCYEVMIAKVSVEKNDEGKYELKVWSRNEFYKDYVHQASAIKRFEQETSHWGDEE